MSLLKLEQPATPLLPYVLCKADMEQKKIVHLSDEVDIYIDNKYNENLRERNPNIAYVVYSNDTDKFKGYDKGQVFNNKLVPGDKVYLQHFQLLGHSNESLAMAEDVSGDELFLVDLREVYFKVVNNEPVMLSNYMLCEYEEISDRLPSGLLIPAMAEENILRNELKRAVVRYISDEVSDKIKVGDVILFEKHADYRLTFNGKEYLKMSSTEVLAKIQDNKILAVAA